MTWRQEANLTLELNVMLIAENERQNPRQDLHPGDGFSGRDAGGDRAVSDPAGVRGEQR